MVKMISLGVVIFLLALLLIEGLALLRLRSNEKTYANYWKNLEAQGDFVYVALGDSAAQGIGASSPEKGYVGLLAQDISQKTGKSVKIVNLSVSGAKIQNVIDNQLPELAKLKPDLVTVEVGSNNIRKFDGAEFKKQYEELASKLPKGTYMANIPYFGGLYGNNTEAILVSKIIADVAQANRLILVDLQSETKNKQSIRNYAADYFHPSDRAYKIWRDAFWRQIEPNL